MMKKLFCLVFVLAFGVGLSGCALKHKREADADKIVDAYKAQKEQVKQCYTQAMLSNKNLQGTVTLAWEVNGKGQLLKSWVKNTTLHDAEMEKCLLDHLETVQFPPTQSLAKITVEYELSFQR